MKQSRVIYTVIDKLDVPTWSYRLCVAATLLGSAAFASIASTDKDVFVCFFSALASVFGFYAAMFYMEILTKHERKVDRC